MATEQTVESVKMSDGRITDFPGKRKLNKDSFIGADGSVAVRLDFRNGETRTFTCPKNLIEKAAAHGLEQKLGDEIAGEQDIDDCVLAIDELIARLNKGDWTTKREGGGMSGTSVLLRAIVEVTGKPVDKVKAYLSGKSQAEKMALRNSPKYAEVVKRIEAEKQAAKPKVDTAPLEDEIAAL